MAGPKSQILTTTKTKSGDYFIKKAPDRRSLLPFMKGRTVGQKKKKTEHPYLFQYKLS